MPCGAIPVSMIPMSQGLPLRSLQQLGLEEGVVKLTDKFSCPGFRVVEDRRIRCHKAGDMEQRPFTRGNEFLQSCVY